MRTPPGYEPNVGDTIDAHVEAGLRPNVYVLNSLKFGSCLERFLEDHFSGQSVLHIGARSGALFGSGVIKGQVFEPRDRYSRYLKAHFSEDVICEDWAEALPAHEVIVVSLEYIAEEGFRREALWDLSMKISNQRFFLIRFRWEGESKGLRYNQDGVLCNFFEMTKWFDLQRSQMHLGYDTHSLETCDLYDLTRRYPTLISRSEQK